MPAISPARLKKDVSRLMTEFGSPDVFDVQLGELLDYYADRTIRPSETGPPDTLLPAHKVPKPVLRALEVGLRVYIDFDQEATLRLADRLWSRPWFEYKYLAIYTLGSMQVDEPAPVIERLLAWMRETADEKLQAEAFSAGAKKDLDRMLETIEIMQESKEPSRLDIALVGMASLARQADEAALPSLYRLYGRALENIGDGGQARLLSVTRALAKRSPGETAYFLRQLYLVSMRPEIGRVLRHCLPLFPDPIRQDLLNMLREVRG